MIRAPGDTGLTSWVYACNDLALTTPAYIDPWNQA